MQSEHPNVDLIASIDTTDIVSNLAAFHPDVVWRFFNPMAPELAGSYNGISGMKAFFSKVRSFGKGHFAVQPIGAWAVGDELVVVQTRNRLGDGRVARSQRSGTSRRSRRLEMKTPCSHLVVGCAAASGQMHPYERKPAHI